MKQADRVIIPESPCRCGGRFIVLHIVGEPHNRTMHTKPSCPQHRRAADSGNLDAYLEWVRNGDDEALEKSPPAKPNRRQRRQQARGRRHAQKRR